MLSNYVFLDECLEDRQVPDVDNEETSSTRHEEGEGKNTKVVEALVVHPTNDQDPDEKGEDVQESISDVLFRVMGSASYDVNNPCLVKDSIDFSYKAQHRKAHRLFCDESPSEANDDQNVMDHEHAGPAIDDHVHGFCQMNTQGEDDQMLSRERGCQHQVCTHRGGVIESQHCPGTCYSCAQSGNESRPPLPSS